MRRFIYANSFFYNRMDLIEFTEQRYKHLFYSGKQKAHTWVHTTVYYFSITHTQRYNHRSLLWGWDNRNVPWNCSVHLQFVCGLVHSCVCLCVFKAILVNEKEKPCLISCFFSAHPLNRSTLFLYSACCKNPQNSQVWHRNYDFFSPKFSSRAVCLFGKLSEQTQRPCLFIVLQGNWIHHPDKQLYIHLHIFVRFHKTSRRPVGGPDPKCWELLFQTFPQWNSSRPLL